MLIILKHIVSIIIISLLIISIGPANEVLLTIYTPDRELNNTGICPILYSTITAVKGPFSYQWFESSRPINDATGSTYTACYPGIYSLSITNASSNIRSESNELVVKGYNNIIPANIIPAADVSPSKPQPPTNLRVQRYET
jgi:hypothetical protein